MLLILLISALGFGPGYLVVDTFVENDRIVDTYFILVISLVITLIATEIIR